MRRVFALVPQGVEITSKVKKIEGNPVRLVRQCRSLDEARELREPPGDAEFAEPFHRNRPPDAATTWNVREVIPVGTVNVCMAPR